MAKMGNWGTYLKFQTKSSQILAPNKLGRKASFRTSKHSMIDGLPKVEGVGLDLQSVTISVYLDASMGVKPRSTEESLLKKLGYVAPLVIGGKNLCSKAMLTGISSAYEIILKHGEVYAMSIDLTFTEYN